MSRLHHATLVFVLLLSQFHSVHADDWPMFGGTPGRNMVNLAEKNIPAEWNIAKGKRKNIKWTVKLGLRLGFTGLGSVGGVVVADGKIFIGANNQRPLDGRFVHKNGFAMARPIDMGVMVCFREKDGKFLWQAVHKRLPTGLINDWPLASIVSNPVVEGDRLYYVSNRCELICADTHGFRDGENDGVQDEWYKGKHAADIVWRLDMIRELGVFPHNRSSCSPLIVGDHVFVVTSNGVDESHIEMPSPKAPSFIAVHKQTGKVVWKNNSPTRNVLAVKAKGRKRVAAIKSLRLAFCTFSQLFRIQLAGPVQRALAWYLTGL